MNEAFSTNVIGCEVSFQVQPYTSAKGKIVSCTPRTVKGVKGFDSNLGTTFTTYEVFDIVVDCESGHHQGAFWGGMPVGKGKDMAGERYTVTGVRFGQLSDAAFGVIDMEAKDHRGEKRPIIQAFCG